MQEIDILKAATDWAKAEVFSTPFFMLFGGLFLLASMGFWRLGQTALAKAYVIPLLVAGTLLFIIGAGLFYTNKQRVKQFQADHASNPVAFVEAELTRTDATLKEYRNVVFTAIPLIIIACALGLMFLSGPNWRASLITIIAMLTVILLIDGTAYGRMDGYREQLVIAKGKDKG